MYGIFTYIYHKIQPNVGKYTIHGIYGLPELYSSVKSQCFPTKNDENQRDHGPPNPTTLILLPCLEDYPN